MSRKGEEKRRYPKSRVPTNREKYQMLRDLLKSRKGVSLVYSFSRVNSSKIARGRTAITIADALYADEIRQHANTEQDPKQQPSYDHPEIFWYLVGNAITHPSIQ